VIARVLIVAVFLILILGVMAWSFRGVRKLNQDEFRMSREWREREARRERDGRS
jgi:hypothetical protein